MSSLGLSLLNSSPPGGTELRQANALLNSELSKVLGLASPVRRYTQHLTQAVESTQSQQKRKRGKTILLKGKYVFSTEEVLEMAKEAEKVTAANKTRKKRKTFPIMVEMTQTRLDMSESDESDSESDCIVVASLRQL